jgi:hypothetical protein
MTNMSWIQGLEGVLSHTENSRHEIVISPDVDGLLSAAVLAFHRPVHIIGAYTTTHLLLGKGITKQQAANALWLDHDVSEPGVRCVGQHLVLLNETDSLPRREPVSFNPNIWFPQSWDKSFKGSSGKKRDKYPFGTAHFLASALDLSTRFTSPAQIALFAHADGTWRTVVDYFANAEIWQSLMFPNDPLIRALMNEYHLNPKHLEAHRQLIQMLLATGIKSQPSRSPKAALLPPELRELTGKQSIAGVPTVKPFEYFQRIGVVAQSIASIMGSHVTIAEPFGEIVSGNYHSLYPNQLPDGHETLDSFMDGWKVFSHAFVNFRSLKVTNGIKLNG